MNNNYKDKTSNNLFNTQDQQYALNQQQATILQTYIDNIQDLLLNHNLLKSKPDEDIAILARARTLTALQGLDPARKGRLVIFLAEFGGTNFSNAILNYTSFENTDLTFTNLTQQQLNQVPFCQNITLPKGIICRP